ncbi:MAG: TetR/AcrR family transcriptional regulator [Gemmatimonadaceae bacterium]
MPQPPAPVPSTPSAVRSARPSTKQRLRHHALDLIASEGVQALSVRTLCRSMGIRESSFYAHFPSKEALLEELLQQAGAEAPSRIADGLADAGLPLAEYVHQLVQQLVALWTQPDGRKLRVLLEAEASRVPALRDRFNAGILAMIDAVGDSLGRYVRDGTLAAHGAPRVLAWSLVAPVAAMRFSLFANGASEAHVAEGAQLAAAHAEAWVRAHAIGAHPIGANSTGGAT